MDEQLSNSSLVVASQLIDSFAPLFVVAFLLAAGTAVFRTVHECNAEYLVSFLLVVVLAVFTFRKTTAPVGGVERTVYLLPKAVSRLSNAVGSLASGVAGRGETEPESFYIAAAADLSPELKLQVIESYEACILPPSLMSRTFVTDIYSPAFEGECGRRMQEVRTRIEAVLKKVKNSDILRSCVNFVYFREAGIKPAEEPSAYMKTVGRFSSPIMLVSYGNQRDGLARAYRSAFSIIALTSAAILVSLPLILLIFPFRPRIIVLWAATLALVQLSAIVPAFMLTAAASGGFDSQILYSVTRFGGPLLAACIVAGILFLRKCPSTTRL